MRKLSFLKVQRFAAVFFERKYAEVISIPAENVSLAEMKWNQLCRELMTAQREQ